MKNKNETFECDDRYEAEKLAGLLSVQKDNSIWVTGVLALVGNEIVIQLRDKSSHAVLLRNVDEAEKLQRFLKAVTEGRTRITSSRSRENVAEISLAD